MNWTGEWTSLHRCLTDTDTQTHFCAHPQMIFCTRPSLPPRSTTIHPLTLARTWISPFAPPYASAVSATQSPGPVNSVPQNIFNIVSSPPSILSLSVSQTKVKKRTSDLNRDLTKDTQMANQLTKGCPKSTVGREMKIKITMRYHYTPMRIAQIWNTGNTWGWWGCGASRTLTCGHWEGVVTLTLEASLVVSYTTLTPTTLPSNHAPRYLAKGAKKCMSTQKNNLHKNVYSRMLIHNCKNFRRNQDVLQKW